MEDNMPPKPEQEKLTSHRKKAARSSPLEMLSFVFKPSDLDITQASTATTEIEGDVTKDLANNQAIVEKTLILEETTFVIRKKKLKKQLPSSTT